jgi:hypothetical protein
MPVEFRVGVLNRRLDIGDIGNCPWRGAPWQPTSLDIGRLGGEWFHWKDRFWISLVALILFDSIRLMVWPCLTPRNPLVLITDRWHLRRRSPPR